MATKSGVADAGLVARPSLTLKRRLNAPPAKIYAAWTDPEKIIRWFGRRRTSSRLLSGRHRPADRRAFSCQFLNADDEYYEVNGVYREVVPNARLVFGWAWHSTPERESQVTVSLQARRRRNVADLHHEQLFDQAARDGHERGWIGSLDALEKYLA